jgi:hypothetical protein
MSSTCTFTALFHCYGIANQFGIIDIQIQVLNLTRYYRVVYDRDMCILTHLVRYRISWIRVHYGIHRLVLALIHFLHYPFVLLL